MTGGRQQQPSATTRGDSSVNHSRVSIRMAVNTAMSLTLAFTGLSGPRMADWWQEHRKDFSERCSPVTIGSVAGFARARYNVTATPTHYLVGADGRVKHRVVGMLAEVPSWVDE